MDAVKNSLFAAQDNTKLPGQRRLQNPLNQLCHPCRISFLLFLRELIMIDRQIRMKHRR
ncbi:hypothetical protein HMPREF1548_03245 [Clostridium sp. KLE 1755]|nr:hypothetical protein HMPREF1548_03245 [Clostridium sp. KLE 1755]